VNYDAPKLFTYIFYICGFIACLVLMNGKINQSIIIHTVQNNTSGIDINNTSRDLTSNHYNQYNTMIIRKINGNDVDERKKFRWLYKSFETSVYRILERTFHLNNIGKYSVLLHYTIIMFMSFLLSSKIFDHAQKLQHKVRQDARTKIINAVIFFSIYQFVLLLTSLDEWFTFVELFALLLAIYSSLNKNILLFIVAVVIGVSNRESGMALGLIYPLLHYNQMSTRLIISLVVSPFVFFTVINFDIINDFYRLIIYGVNNNEFRIFLFSPSSFSHVTTGELANYFFTYIAFLFPLIYMLIRLPKSDLTTWIRLISIIYISIMLVGSYIGNFMLLLLLLPSYVLVFSVSQEKVD